MIHIQRAYPAPATLTSDKAQEARAELERLVQAGQTELEQELERHSRPDAEYAGLARAFLKRQSVGNS